MLATSIAWHFVGIAHRRFVLDANSNYLSWEFRFVPVPDQHVWFSATVSYAWRWLQAEPHVSYHQYSGAGGPLLVIVKT